MSLPPYYLTIIYSLSKKVKINISMTTTCKCTITRPSLDSLFVFELDEIIEKISPNRKMIMIDRCPEGRTIEALHADTVILESKLSPGSPKIILKRYEEFIYWNEVIERKNELRPDIRYRLDQLGLLANIENLNDISEGPNFNPFSLTHTRNAVYETFEDWELNYNYFFNQILEGRKRYYSNFFKEKHTVESSLNTVHEELYIDGILTEYKNFKQIW
jgi:hypothetical protein